MGWIPGLGRSPETGHGNPLQYSRLENLMDRGAWWAMVIGLQRVGHDTHSSFTMLGQLLLYNNVNQLSVCNIPFLLSLPAIPVL